LASAKGAVLEPKETRLQVKITNNLSVGGTIDSLVVTVMVAFYRGKMILINDHEAKIWDISKNIKRQYKILRKKELEPPNPIGLQNSRA
jgi:hypothetical protein